MSEKTVRCPLCESTDVMPRTGITIYPNYKADLVFSFKGSTGLFRKAISIPVGRASVCLNCGHVMWACDEKELEKLRANKADLIPV